MTWDDELEARFLAALSHYADHQIDDTELAWLNECIKSDETARIRFLEVAHDALTVAEFFADGATLADDEATIEATRKPRPIKILPILLATAAAVMLVFQIMNQSSSASVTIAHLDATVGTVQVVRDGEIKTASEFFGLLPNDRIETRAANASAAIVYGDGTRLVLAGDAAIELKKGEQKRLKLLHGDVMVAARPQPADQPMVISTPRGIIEVVGTTFAISAEADKTQLGVIEGKVIFRNKTLGKSVNVAGGQRAVADAASLTTDVLDAPENYRAEFTPATLANWRYGQLFR